MLQFFAFGRVLKIRVNFRFFRRLQFQLGEPAFVENRHGRLVLDGALDVVNGNVIAKHCPRVGVGLFNRRAGEADEGGVRQRVAHVPGEAVNEIVLAAVRLVGNDDDVAPVGKQRMFAAFVFREKFLNGREHHAAATRRRGVFSSCPGSAPAPASAGAIHGSGRTCRKAGRQGRCGR